jgi:hypothetical protein
MPESTDDPSATEAMLTAIEDLDSEEDQYTALGLVEKVEGLQKRQSIEKLSIPDWIEAGDEIIDFFESFPEWDEKTIHALERIHEKVYKDLLLKGDQDQIDDFVYRWNGWVGEAAMRRLYKQFQESYGDYKLDDLYTDPLWDAMGADGMFMMVNKDYGIMVYLQAKTSMNGSIGISLKRPEQTAISEDTRKRMTEGNIREFCLEQTEAALPQIVEKLQVDDPNFDPDNFRLYSMPVAVVVGMVSKNGPGEPPEGWAKLMRKFQAQKVDFTTWFNDDFEELLKDKESYDIAQTQQHAYA